MHTKIASGPTNVPVLATPRLLPETTLSLAQIISRAESFGRPRKAKRPYDSKENQRWRGRYNAC